jgi:hypothetical protein
MLGSRPSNREPTGRAAVRRWCYIGSSGTTLAVANAETLEEIERFNQRVRVELAKIEATAEEARR